MCFSAVASFSSGTVLTGIGIISMTKAGTTGQRIFAGIPLLFGFQQLTEGVLWLSLLHEQYHPGVKPATILFMLVAQVLWPVIVPLTMYNLETDLKRKKWLGWLLGTGIAIGAYVSICFFFFPIQATIDHYHIKYHIHFPLSNTLVSAVAYLIPTVIPPFLSSFIQIRWLGALLVFSFIITSIFYRDYTISVWCFFASIISIVCLFIIVDLRKEVTDQDLNGIQIPQGN